MVALEYSRGHSLQNNAIHLSGGAHVLHGIKFLKNIRIPLVVSLIIVRMNQSQQRFLPLMHRITGSYDPNSKNKLKIRIFPHYHFCSSFILTQFFKEKIWEFHTISAMRHHLVFMSHFYCILRHEVVYSQTSSMIQVCLYLTIKRQFYQRELEGSVYTQFESDGVICPTKLCSNVFTTFAVDNINNNPSFHSAKDSWYGTAIISSTQQPLQKEYATVHLFLFKLTDIYAPRLPKRKDIVPFGISLIWCHAQLKRQTNAYFIMQKPQLNRIAKYSLKLLTVMQWLLRYQYIIVYLTRMNYGCSSGGESIKLWSNVSELSSLLQC